MGGKTRIQNIDIPDYNIRLSFSAEKSLHEYKIPDNFNPITFKTKKTLMRINFDDLYYVDLSQIKLL